MIPRTIVVNLSGNRISSLKLYASQGYKCLDLHDTGISDYGSIYAGTGYNLIIDYDEKIDFSSLKNAKYSNYYIIDCPLDKQVAVRDTLGISSTRFVNAAVCEEVMSNYINDVIKGSSVYFE